MANMNVGEFEGASQARTSINTQVDTLISPGNLSTTSSTYIFDLGTNLICFEGTDLNWAEAEDIQALPGFQGGTISSFQALAPDGVTVLFSITNLSVPLEIFINGTSYADPTWGGGQRPASGFDTLLLGADRIDGSSFADSLVGLAGDDTINGFGGTDVINGGAGDDTINGGDDWDDLYGGTGADVINGGAGDDRLHGHGLNSFDNAGFIYVPDLDTLNGGEGNDALFAQFGPGNDWASGDPYPFAGGVIADGGSGHDVLVANLSHIADNLVVDLRDPSTAVTFSDGSSIIGVEAVHLVLGDGNDTIYDGAEADVIYSGGGNDTIHYGGSGNGEFYYYSGSSPATIDTGDGDDTVYWSNVDGNVALSGGNGFDSLIVDWSAMGTGFSIGWLPQDFEFVSFLGSSKGDIIQAYPGTGQRIVAWGGDGGDSLVGSSLEDELAGGDGDDMITGGGGDDQLLGDSGNDTLDGDSGSDALDGGLGHDTLNGGEGNDTLDGGAGADTMTGGKDNDTYYVDNAGDKVIEKNETGVDSVFSSVSFSLAGQYIEELILTGAAAINGTGNGHDNTITGNDQDNVLDGGLSGSASGNDTLNGMGGNDTLDGRAGNDTLDGGLGADRMIGGLGNDTFFVDNVGDRVVEKNETGIDTVFSSVSFSLAGQYIEKLVLTGSAAINGTGNGHDNTITGNDQDNVLDGGLYGITSGNDTLYGMGGNDTLDGRTGADTMVGGLGNDTFFVDNAGDKVIERNETGIDTVFSSVSFSLAGQFVEELILTGSAAVNGTGNGHDNDIIGNDAANILDGGTYGSVSGNDWLNGMGGNDTLYGRGGHDLLVGGFGDDQLFGGDGYDDLFGGTGADQLFGGDGDDDLWISVEDDAEGETYSGGAGWDDLVVYGPGGTINLRDDTLSSIEVLSFFQDETATFLMSDMQFSGIEVVWGWHGTDIVDIQLDTQSTFDISALELQDFGNGLGEDRFIIRGDATGETIRGSNATDEIYGNDGADTLFGMSGDDTLDGGLGADTMTGGLGNDTYFVDNVGDRVIERNETGFDSVFSSVSFSLAGQFVEELVLTGAAAINGTGNGHDNTITGNDQANILDGGLSGSASGNDTLYGMGGNDTIDGRAGNDTLFGGLGNDTLTGGANNDTFVFDTALNAATNVDTITDFSVPQDTIQLDDAIFAAIGPLGTLAAAAFTIGTAATTAAHRIIYNSATGALIYDSNGSAAGGATQFATLATGLALTNADFVVA